MKCPACKTEISDGSRFCNHCGSKIEVQGRTCPKPECGKTGLPEHASFCPECGTKLNVKQEVHMEEAYFKCNSGTFVDERDNREYKWIRIGGQIWMAENLDFEASKGCWVYEDRIKNARKYGRLYNWESAFKVCPVGWHLPTLNEWNVLIKFLEENDYGSDSILGSSIGNALSSTTEWKEAELLKIKVELNESGFNGKPGGHYDSDIKKYYDLGERALWWTATEVNKNEAIALSISLYIFNYSLDDETENKEFGLSVRCIKD